MLGLDHAADPAQDVFIPQPVDDLFVEGIRHEIPAGTVAALFERVLHFSGVDHIPKRQCDVWFTLFFLYAHDSVQTIFEFVYSFSHLEYLQFSYTAQPQQSFHRVILRCDPIIGHRIFFDDLEYLQPRLICLLHKCL